MSTSPGREIVGRIVEFGLRSTRQESSRSRGRRADPSSDSIEHSNLPAIKGHMRDDSEMGVTKEGKAWIRAEYINEGDKIVTDSHITLAARKSVEPELKNEEILTVQKVAGQFPRTRRITVARENGETFSFYMENELSASKSQNPESGAVSATKGLSSVQKVVPRSDTRSLFTA